MISKSANEQTPLLQAGRVVCFFHDIEQDSDWNADVARCRQVVDEFLRLEKAHGVRATYNVVGRILDEQPDLIERIRQGGHEVAFHSYHHQTDWQPAHYAAEVQRCRAASPDVRGYRSPQSRWNRSTLRACWEEGFAWNAEADRAAQPYFIYQNLVRIPIAGDDWPVHTGKLAVRAWQDRFALLLRNNRFLAYGSHDCVFSLHTEERLAGWEYILRQARSADAACVTFAEAATLARPGLAMLMRRAWRKLFRVA